MDKEIGSEFNKQQEYKITKKMLEWVDFYMKVDTLLKNIKHCIDFDTKILKYKKIK